LTCFPATAMNISTWEKACGISGLMTRYDVVVIGAGLGGLTAGAILARDGRKVLVIERSNSVGGAASSYKVGDLFVEGSLHETSDPRNPRDPKHDLLKRAGVLEAVTWSPNETFYEVRGGPVALPLALPANFGGARAALIQRFPEARNAFLEGRSARPRASRRPKSRSRLKSTSGQHDSHNCVSGTD